MSSCLRRGNTGCQENRNDSRIKATSAATRSAKYEARSLVGTTDGLDEEVIYLQEDKKLVVMSY